MGWNGGTISLTPGPTMPGSVKFNPAVNKFAAIAASTTLMSCTLFAGPTNQHCVVFNFMTCPGESNAQSSHKTLQAK